MKIPREFWIPEGAEEVNLDGANCVVYTYLGGKDAPCAMSFYGKKSKATDRYRFATVEKRDTWVADTLANAKAWEDKKAEDKAKRAADKKEAMANAVVGDIYYCSWGYDQTNIDFYEIVAKKGVNIEIRKVSKILDRSERGADYVCAKKGSYIGEEVIKKRFNGSGNITMNSYSSAYPWSGTPKYETAWGYGH
jgi:hypothetical protein|tara:strand:- start:8419 stop:8997 length:579 start_codon:yes stop_codon:yes gene_type:complete